MITIKKATKPPGLSLNDLVIGNVYTFNYHPAFKGAKDGFIFIVGLYTETGRKVGVVLEKFGNCSDVVGNVFELPGGKTKPAGTYTPFGGEVTIKND